MHPHIEEVALFAILLRETARQRHSGEISHLEDLECVPEELNLAALVASSRFGELEWRLAELLADDEPGHLVVEASEELLSSGDHLLAEAILHAHGERGKRTRAHWAARFNARWRRVRNAMRAFEAEGLVVRFGDLNLIADTAYQAITGATQEEINEQFGEPVWGHDREAVSVGV